MKYYQYKSEDYEPMHHDSKKDGKDINIIVKCGDGNGEQELAAFRAVNNALQRVDVPDEFYKVLFQEEQFDIGGIYNANTSTFVPREDGVYYVAGTVTFFPDNTEDPYRVRVEIRVNGVSVAADNDYWGEGFLVNAINVATILQLEAGDLVEIFLTSTTPGVIEQNSTEQQVYSTRFEASKF
ncbi:hypothetical protein AB685_08380 [Bacillus sp. LL01]|uniref:C1q-like domain-containing protein n=1 Tax=Bacillus sp. LL01 TaxID=1665556 RepID=UPI00064CF21B|nr:hypothetical protein [Bacillus sp. LL01]KMJ59072.1 hypothetical protein AB685_08380 [Bacillus sp. LL01]